MLKTAADKILLTAPDEQRAFRILYDRYWKLLYKKALSRLNNNEDAQDVVQEVFISLWRNRYTIEVRDSLSPYLCSALRYAVIKRMYQHSQRETKLMPSEELCDHENYPEAIVQYRELQQVIGREVLSLPARMQEIYRMSRIEQLPAREIAKRLRISEQTVKNTLSTTLKKLRVKLSNFTSFFAFFL